MLPKSYTSPRESTSPGSIFRKLYSCPIHTQNQLTKRKEKHLERLWARTHTHTHRHTHLHTHTHSNSTWLDVVSDDAYMLVSVRACVFVPEADHVAEFMNHNAKLITVLSDGDGLRAATSPPHVGATPAGGDTVQLRANNDSLLLVNI